MMRFDINACFGHWQYWELPQKSPDELIALMDRHGIARAAVCSLRGVLADWRAGNEETRAAATLHSDRLLPVATLSPFMAGDGDEVRRLAKLGMCGVRLYPIFHNYQLNSSFVDEVCEAARDFHLPVMIPTRPMMNWRFRTVPIESIGEVADRHPATTIILSGPNYLVEYQAMLKVLNRCPNVLYETSCLQGFDGIGRLVDAVGAERVLFGTGAMLHNPGCNVVKLDHARLTNEQRWAIAGENALRLLAPVAV